ncbi:hypothetical protein F5883DRAFT_417039 [Diaporthe sp. PMI_573]|nr:hypothetical protein F5883DRAFT_417039 [Diaporthaceae sp. PMI_573]
MVTAGQNETSSLTSFTKFAELPPELQLQIWESTIACQPSMHLFDVCVPPCVSESAQMTIASPTSESHIDDDDGDDGNNNNNEDTDTRLSKGGEVIYLDEVTDTLYLSPLSTTTTDDLSSQENSTAQGALFRTDPSMYKFRGSLSATCIDAAATVRRSTTGRGSSSTSGDTNTIYLGAPSTARGCASVTYDNTQDVLHLRFVPPAFRFPDGSRRLTSPVSAIFESVWSQELAGALHRARRVAIDVSQLWPDLGARDIAFLACTMQHDLEVLYLVDYRAGRCDPQPSQPSSLRARDLMDRSDEGLYRALRNGEAWKKEKMREPDVIQGVGKVWREVFDLEKMGWHEEHPGFVFGEMFAEVVKMQQGNWMGDDEQVGQNTKERARFKGVRVLVAEDEEVNG